MKCFPKRAIGILLLVGGLICLPHIQRISPGNFLLERRLLGVCWMCPPARKSIARKEIPRGSFVIERSVLGYGRVTATPLARMFQDIDEGGEGVMETTQVPSDRQLLESYYAGDDGAMDALYTRYNRSLFVCAARILRNSDEAMEMTHDAFVKLMYTRRRAFGR